MHPDLANRMKVGGDRPGGANQQSAEDTSPGFLERAMVANTGEPELGAQVNRSDEGSTGTVINADGTTEVWHDGAMTGSTANTETGSPVFKEIKSPTGDERELLQDITMESRVTLQNGMEMSVRSALEAGFISQQPDGTFQAGPVDSSAQEKAPEDREDLDPSDAGEFLPPADEAVMDELVASTSGQDQVDYIHQLTSGDGEIDPHLINRISSEAGLEPTVMHGKIESVASAMRTQASAAVAKHGVDPEALWAWINEPANVGALQAAVRKHAMTRSTAAYGDIAKSYILAMDEHSPDAILSADLGDGIRRTYRDDRGNIVIEDASGRGYTWKSAIRSGLVKLA